jgi:hypothetical protein
MVNRVKPPSLVRLVAADLKMAPCNDSTLEAMNRECSVAWHAPMISTYIMASASVFGKKNVQTLLDENPEGSLCITLLIPYTLSECN